MATQVWGDEEDDEGGETIALPDEDQDKIVGYLVSEPFEDVPRLTFPIRASHTYQIGK